AAHPACLGRVIAGPQFAAADATHEILDVIADAIGAGAPYPTGTAHDVDDQPRLLGDLANAGRGGRLARPATSARDRPAAGRGRPGTPDQQQASAVVEDNSTRTRLPYARHWVTLKSRFIPGRGVGVVAVACGKKNRTCVRMEVGQRGHEENRGGAGR